LKRPFFALVFLKIDYTEIKISVLRKIFGAMKVEAAGRRHCEELHNLYSSTSIINT
jgi:hypothetical protein